MEEYQRLLESGMAGLADREILFFGDGVKVYQDRIKHPFAAEDKTTQKASSVAKMALKLYNEGKQVNYKELTPVYMRKAEAERKLEEGFPALRRESYD